MRTPIPGRITAPVVLAVLAAGALLVGDALHRDASAQAERPMSLEVFLRRFYGLPARVRLTVGQPRPAPVAGLETVSVTLGEPPRTQTLEVMRSADGHYVGLAPLIDTRQDPFAQTAARLDLKDRPSRGDAGALVTIVEYSDFQCPYCRRMSPVVEETMTGRLAKDVRWVYKHFPLRIHPWAEPAAIASECARQVGGNEAFWKLHDLYFAEQETFSVENHRARVMAWARKAGLAPARFERCLDGPAAQQKVRADLAEGQAIGVDSTPTLVINGRPSPGLKSAEELAGIIEQEIAYQRERRRVAGE